MTRVFKGCLATAGLRETRFRGLRHTFGSQLIQNGASLVYVRDQMGHSSIRVTADIYGHLIPSANVNAVDRLDAQTTPQESATQAQPRPRCRARKSRQLVEKIGGPGGVRTLDLMTASHARSQLRHRPRQTSITVCNMGPVGCQRSRRTEGCVVDATVPVQTYEASGIRQPVRWRSMGSRENSP